MLTHEFHFQVVCIETTMRLSFVLKVNIKNKIRTKDKSHKLKYKIGKQKQKANSNIKGEKMAGAVL